MDVSQVRADLLAEQGALDEVVAALDDEQWSLPTPSPRWSVADQIGHLTYFDGAAATAITDPDAFTVMVDELMSTFGRDVEAADDATLGPFRKMGHGELVESWRVGRKRLAVASVGLADDDRVIWYGPSMGSKSFLTARLMEAWAHGQDIVDALGVARPATDRLRHIVQLGFITRGWSYVNRGLEVPGGEVRVELSAPSGELWTYGPEGADSVVRGDARDFCLVVTQRRNVHDTGLVVEGHVAQDWLDKAQAFAGPPTRGPEAGSRR